MKKFLNILPDLKLSHEMTELFETVECEKVAASRDHSRIKIYIHSDRLIAHKAIRETERAIRSQMFKDQVDVCLVEKYHLSRQYTPARLLEAYTGSLIDGTHVDTVCQIIQIIYLQCIISGCLSSREESISRHPSQYNTFFLPER